MRPLCVTLSIFEKVHSDMQLGVYRVVFCIGNKAFKFPRLRNLMQGMRCNRWEREMWERWRPLFGWTNLCPIKFADSLGLVVIMSRAEQPVTFDEVKAAVTDDYPNVMMETKPENFGRLAGQVLVLDYGLHDSDLVSDRRNYYNQKAASLHA